ncbi:transposase [Euzebyella saccharophila]|uniref:Transposase n=1 Tax=Euzebyella saccharophila TaxID=679664 RepID=A0ABV8JQ36_9FLAO|nr:transposase [Euzebyella saccharophila]
MGKASKGGRLHEYARNIARVESPKGPYMKGKQQSTVEPVFGTLIEFMVLRKINTIGFKKANKAMHLSAIAYNLKKYLKFELKRSKSGERKLALLFFIKNRYQELERTLVGLPKNLDCPVS